MTIFINRVVLSLGCALILQAAATTAAEMSEQISHSGTRMMDDKGMMAHKQMQSEGMQGKMGETPMQAQGMHDQMGDKSMSGMQEQKMMSESPMGMSEKKGGM
ncbi:hypothetical protein [Candidatus Endoriftia persephone]|jgi:hypothetical protein|nr:hypothetical protein [Candidatus Endoriftia persephone]USF86588.1 hypothetical protein L0Y14_10600 [Candidatus Endoriftia persephone]